ncbi:hypothetical protein CerSpe_187280 [Prunus speciosa]
MVLSKSQASIMEQSSIHPHTPSRTPPRTETIWKAPMAPIIKINVDGACNKDTLEARTGCVIRDYRGHSLGGESDLSILSSSEETEAMAVLKGLNLAADFGHQNIVLESDVMSVVECITKKRKKASWKIFPIISAIWRKTHDFQYIH